MQVQSHAFSPRVSRERRNASLVALSPQRSNAVFPSPLVIVGSAWAFVSNARITGAEFVEAARWRGVGAWWFAAGGWKR